MVDKSDKGLQMQWMSTKLMMSNVQELTELVAFWKYRSFSNASAQIWSILSFNARTDVTHSSAMLLAAAALPAAITDDPFAAEVSSPSSCARPLPFAALVGGIFS